MAGTSSSADRPFDAQFQVRCALKMIRGSAVSLARESVILLCVLLCSQRSPPPSQHGGMTCSLISWHPAFPFTFTPLRLRAFASALPCLIRLDGR